MTFLLSVLVFLLLGTLFVLVWAKSTGGRVVVTPLLLFGTFEIISVWPATIFAQLTGASLTGAFPALLAALAFGALLLGFVAIMAVTRCSSQQPSIFRDSPMLRTHPDSSYLLAIVLVGCVLIGLGLFLYEGIPPFVEGLMALGTGPSGVESAINIIANGRELVTKGHYLGGTYRGQGVILELMQDGWPYLEAVACLLFVLTRRRRWLVATIVLGALMLFFIAGSGQRWQVVAALFYVGLVLSLATRVRARWATGIVLATTLVYVGMSLLNSNYEDLATTDDPLATFTTRASSRIVFGNGLHNVEGINFVEDGSLKFGFGSIHFQKFFTSIPGVGKDEVPFSLRLALLVDPYRSADDSTFASQTYFGWLYDDLGVPGVVVVYFVVGGVLAWAQWWLFTRPKGLLDLPALGFAIYYLGELSLDGPATFSASSVIVAALWVTMRACVALASSRWSEVNVREAGALRDLPLVRVGLE